MVDECDWEGCRRVATKVLKYRRVRMLDELAIRRYFCDEHADDAIVIYSRTWNVVAWLEEPMSAA